MQLSCAGASRGYGHGHRVLWPRKYIGGSSFLVFYFEFVQLFGWHGKGEGCFGLTWVVLGGLGGVTGG